MYFVNKFIYKGGIRKFITRLKLSHQDATLDSFKNQLISFSAERKKQMGPSQKKPVEDKNNRTSFLQNNEPPSSASIAEHSIRDYQIQPNMMERG